MKLEQAQARAQQTKRETCRSAFALQDTNLEERVFKGMASVFGTLIDTWIPTVIHAGAFKRTLGDAAAAKRVKVLYQHSEYQPIGKPIRMEETADGLYVEGRISKTTCGTDCLILMQDEVITELSIGFDPVRWEMEQRQESVLRHLYDVDLFEFSPVTFAANRDAVIYSVNSLASGLGLSMELTEQLRPALEQLGQATEAADVLTPVTARLLELHAGKVLSAKNKSLVENAIEALQTLLSATTPAPADEDDDETQARTVSPIIARSMRALDLAALSHGIATT